MLPSENAEDSKIHRRREGMYPRKQFRKPRQKRYKEATGEPCTQAEDPQVHHHHKNRDNRLRDPRGSNSRLFWSEAGCPDHCGDAIIDLLLNGIRVPSHSTDSEDSENPGDSDSSDNAERSHGLHSGSESHEQHKEVPPEDVSPTRSDTDEEKVHYVVGVRETTAAEESNVSNVSSETIPDTELNPILLSILFPRSSSYSSKTEVSTKFQNEAGLIPREPGLESLASNFVDILSKEHHLSVRKTSKNAVSEPCQRRIELVEDWMGLNEDLVECINAFKNVQFLLGQLNRLEDYPQSNKVKKSNSAAINEAKHSELLAQREKLRKDLELVGFAINAAENILANHDASCEECGHGEEHGVPTKSSRSDFARNSPTRKRDQQVSYDLNLSTFGFEAVSEFYNSPRRRSTGIPNDLFSFDKYKATTTESLLQHHTPSSSQSVIGLPTFVHVTDTVGQRLKEELPFVECYQGKDTWTDCPVGLHSLIHGYDSITQHLQSELPCVPDEQESALSDCATRLGKCGSEIPSYNHGAWDLWFKDVRYLNMPVPATKADPLESVSLKAASLSASLSDPTEDTAELNLDRLIQKCKVSIQNLQLNLGIRHENFLDPVEMKSALQNCIATVNLLEKRLHAERKACMEAMNLSVSRNYHVEYLNPHRIGRRYMGSDADLEDMMKWEKGKFAEDLHQIDKPSQENLELGLLFESPIEPIGHSKENVAVTVEKVFRSMSSSNDSAENGLVTDATAERRDSATSTGTKSSLEKPSRSFELGGRTWSTNNLSDIDEDTTEHSDTGLKANINASSPPHIPFKEGTCVAETPEKVDRAVTFDLSPIDPALRPPKNTPISGIGSTQNTLAPVASLVTPERMARRSFGSLRRFRPLALFQAESAGNSPEKEGPESVSAVESEHGSPSPSPTSRGLRGGLSSLRGLITDSLGRRRSNSKAKTSIRDVDYEADTESGYEADGGPLRRVPREPDEDIGLLKVYESEK
jgi:hypothetical protein